MTLPRCNAWEKSIIIIIMWLWNLVAEASKGEGREEIASHTQRNGKEGATAQRREAGTKAQGNRDAS